jgi:hypothetical protein
VKQLTIGRKGIVVLLVAAAVLITGTATAMIPDADGVIHACFKKSGGSLRVVDSALTSCASSETALDWNQSGPPGPTGPSGPAGISGYEIVTTSQQTTDRLLVVQDASCPSGKKVLGGGGRAWLADLQSSGGLGLAVVDGFPVGDSVWRAVFFLDPNNYVPEGAEVILTTYAICANVS